MEFQIGGKISNYSHKTLETETVAQVLAWKHKTIIP